MKIESPQLSESGSRRKASLKADLLVKMGQLHRRRRVARAIGSAAVVVGAVAFYISVTLSPQSTDSGITELVRTEPDTPIPNRTDDSLLAFETVDDNEALDLLAETGQMGVFAQVNGERVLLVVDRQTN